VRPRSRALLIASRVLGAVVLGGACSVAVEDGDGARRPPSPEAREYCALVERFYGRLDEFVSRAQEGLGADADEAELDQRFVGFIRENQDLLERLAAAAPPEIDADAAIQAAAFEQVAVQGTLSPLETPAAKAAETRTVEYEEEECGIVIE
jgi:hypothetical protein